MAINRIHETASVTLTLSEWNQLFIALYDARDAAEAKDYPQTAADFRKLSSKIENYEDLSQRVRRAFAADFPELIADQKRTDEALERKAERERLAAADDLEKSLGLLAETDRVVIEPAPKLTDADWRF
jgi:hypothetical protein